MPSTFLQSESRTSTISLPPGLGISRSIPTIIFESRLTYTVAGVPFAGFISITKHGMSSTFSVRMQRAVA